MKATSAPMDSLLTSSATNLAAMIRAKEVSSREVVDAHIRRIQEVNPTLNAVVQDRFAEARTEADRADARAGDADLPAFHGVPCTIKECFALRSMPNTAGLVSRKGLVVTKDATGVQRLRSAGAIPLGVTNVSELCMWMESSNRVYGRTNNPYDPKRIVGGSSGGEGAIIGAGASPFGLGSDVGGSIRMPAFFNGVFGHKPTGGLVPGSGQYPIAHNEALRYNTTGPLARRAEDLMPLLKILAGPDGEDGGCREMTIGDPATVRMDELTVLVVPGNGVVPVSEELRAAQQAAAAALQARGARVETTSIAELRESRDMWSAMLGAAGGTTFAEYLGDGKKLRLWLEMIRWAVRRSPHTLPALILAAIEPIPKLMPKRAAKAVELGLALRAELARRLGPRGVILYPPYPTTAPPHYKPMWPPFNWVYTAVWNVMEFPVTQVPLGLDVQGLPLGVQVVGAPGSDHVTIAVALELERALGGWVPPPRLPSRPQAGSDGSRRFASPVVS